MNKKNARSLVKLGGFALIHSEHIDLCMYIIYMYINIHAPPVLLTQRNK